VEPLIRAQTQSQTEAALTDWPVWCVFCQKKTPPTVPDQYTPELRQLFPTPSKVPSIFAAIGILHDIHLRILVSIPKVECDAFLRSFIGIQYTQWERVQISAALDTYAKEHADDPLPYWEMEGVGVHSPFYALCGANASDTSARYMKISTKSMCPLSFWPLSTGWGWRRSVLPLCFSASTRTRTTGKLAGPTRPQ
jgi:hypothetical protein